MALPPTTGAVLFALGYGPHDFTFTKRGANFLLDWHHTDPQPTEAQINNWATDAVPLPSGEMFSEWRDSHGADPVKTARRLAADLQGEIGVRVRALIEVMARRDNYNTNRIIELQERVQAMLDSSGNVGNMRSAGLAVPVSPTQTKPRPVVIADYKETIRDGDVD